MQVRVWGCRGSVATSGPDTARYGGNTSCVEVRLESGDVIVLDAGTGMRPLGVSMHHDSPSEIDIFLTHLHLDHLQGLGFFRPLYDPSRVIHLWGPSSPVQSLADRIAMYLSPPLFPVHLEEVPSQLTFHDAPETPITIGSATVRATRVTHQGPTVGYRIEEHGRSFVYIPDHEPSLGADLRTQPTEWMSGHAIARDADVLLHDSQYRDHEYAQHLGWGHACIADTLAFADKAAVEHLVLFHHDPYHDDEELDMLLGDARAAWPGMEERVCLAFDGMTITLDQGGVSVSEPAS